MDDQQLNNDQQQIITVWALFREKTLTMMDDITERLYRGDLEALTLATDYAKLTSNLLAMAVYRGDFRETMAILEKDTAPVPVPEQSATDTDTDSVYFLRVSFHMHVMDKSVPLALELFAAGLYKCISACCTTLCVGMETMTKQKAAEKLSVMHAAADAEKKAEKEANPDFDEFDGLERDALRFIIIRTGLIRDLDSRDGCALFDKHFRPVVEYVALHVVIPRMAEWSSYGLRRGRGGASFIVLVNRVIMCAITSSSSIPLQLLRLCLPEKHEDTIREVVSSVLLRLGAAYEAHLRRTTSPTTAEEEQLIIKDGRKISESGNMPSMITSQQCEAAAHAMRQLRSGRATEEEQDEWQAQPGGDRTLNNVLLRCAYDYFSSYLDDESRKGLPPPPTLPPGRAGNMLRLILPFPAILSLKVRGEKRDREEATLFAGAGESVLVTIKQKRAEGDADAQHAARGEHKEF